MAIKGGKVLRTATAAARRFQQKQFSVTPSSGVGTFLGIPKLIRSDADLLISKYIRVTQNRLTEKGAFSEEKLKAMFSGGNQVVGTLETLKLLEGDLSRNNIGFTKKK